MSDREGDTVAPSSTAAAPTVRCASPDVNAPGTSMRVGNWVLHAETGKTGRVVDADEIWGDTVYRVWLPDDDRVVRARATQLAPLAGRALDDRDQIAYLTAAARVADAIARDVLLAPLLASVIPLPHQVRALQRATSGDRVRFLLADEVGLGKTIEAGLILRELRLCGLVRRALVVAPTGLVRQWESELLTHFGEPFRVVTSDEVKALRGLALPPEIGAALGPSRSALTVWSTFDRVICSLDAVEPIEGRRGWSREQVTSYNRERFEDLIGANWDLVIVDEAHRLAGATDDVARYRLGQGLAGAAPYLLLLSATPHQGKTDGFHRLMSLLDPEDFPDEASITRERIHPYVIRTEKRQAIDARGQPLFRPRFTRLLAIVWDERHRRQQVLYDAVTDYVREGYNQALRERRNYVGFLLLLMQRLVTSSTRAVRVALERRLEALGLDNDSMSSGGEVAPESSLSIVGEGALPDPDDPDSSEQINVLLAARVSALANERNEVGRLLDLARAAEEAGPDAKAEALLAQLYQLQRDEVNPDVKVLDFTEFVPTQEMLRDFLVERGFPTVCLNGAQDVTERRQVQDQFAREAQVLVSTDAGGEGLNLQFSHVVVNYDIPWNPMRLEQRIGRVDRIGQTHPVQALNLVLADSVEHRVQEVLADKLSVILREFGVDKTGDVLDSAQAGAIFDEVYRAGILNPEDVDASAAAAAEQVRAQARAARETSTLLGDSGDLDPDSARRLLDHPLPRWVERMTLSYLRANGGGVQRRDGAWRLTWPDRSTTDNVVFTTDDAAAAPSARQLSLDEPHVRSLVDRLPRAVAGQPIPRLDLPGLPSTVQGHWSLWRIRLHSTVPAGWIARRQRILPLFLHDNGKVFVPTAHRVWDLLLSGPIEPGPGASGVEAAEVFERLRRQAEVHGAALYDELVQQHRAWLTREIQKGEYAFAARRRAIERVGLAAVRAHRLSSLEDQHRAWQASLKASAEVSPELQPVLIVHVRGGTGD